MIFGLASTLFMIIRLYRCCCEERRNNQERPNSQCREFYDDDNVVVANFSWSFSFYDWEATA